MLTEAGRHSLAINKTAGIIQVTDRPSVLKHIELYLNTAQQNINRQVDIEAKIYDVTLNDQFQYGIDWNVVAEYYEQYAGGALGSIGSFGVSALPTAIGPECFKIQVSTCCSPTTPWLTKPSTRLRSTLRLPFRH